MFAQGLAREVGDRGITVNVVQPRPVDTDLNPAFGEWAVPQKALTALNRYGGVDDIASLGAFVAGRQAASITGASLTVESRHERLTRKQFPTRPSSEREARKSNQSTAAVRRKKP